MKKCLAAAAFAVLASVVSAFGQDGPEVVATVDGVEVTRDDMVAYIASLPPEYQEVPLEEYWDAVIERVVNEKLIVAAARADGIDETEAFLDEMAAIEFSVLQQIYMQNAVDNALTDEAVRETYDTWIAELEAEELGEEVWARHILVSSEEDAAAIVERARAGEDFAELAKELSIGPSGVDGGDLGWFRPGDMVPEFEEGAYALQAGEVSNPVQSAFGWHVIKMEERRPIAPPSFEEVEADIRGEMASDAILNTLDRLRADAEIEILMPAPTTE
ncbi:MAG: peptidylprolyl isomerase [Rhodospirillaceae bacterium]|nr:peptidylprolyl isomerase [Rhodospirillaceae bacterium]|tara:strand:+ start:6069 stop:6890 length:822 start_codon:yes stop_codon:yes gene_type:complete